MQRLSRNLVTAKLWDHANGPASTALPPPQSAFRILPAGLDQRTSTEHQPQVYPATPDPCLPPIGPALRPLFFSSAKKSPPTGILSASGTQPIAYLVQLGWSEARRHAPSWPSGQRPAKGGAPPTPSSPSTARPQLVEPTARLQNHHQKRGRQLQGRWAAVAFAQQPVKEENAAKRAGSRSRGGLGHPQHCSGIKGGRELGTTAHATEEIGSTDCASLKWSKNMPSGRLAGERYAPRGVRCGGISTPVAERRSPWRLACSIAATKADGQGGGARGATTKWRRTKDAASFGGLISRWSPPSAKHNAGMLALECFRSVAVDVVHYFCCVGP